MSQSIKQLLLCILLALGLCASVAYAEGIKIKSVELERADNDWLLNALSLIHI